MTGRSRGLRLTRPCQQDTGLRPYTPRPDAGFGVRPLREILDAAVERIGESNPPRIRPDHKSVFLRRVEIDGARQGEAVEDERQAASGDRVRFVEQAKMQVGAL